jgi:hypothetical protein
MEFLKDIRKTYIYPPHNIDKHKKIILEALNIK